MMRFRSKDKGSTLTVQGFFFSLLILAASAIPFNAYALPPYVAKSFNTNNVAIAGGSTLILELFNPNFGGAVLFSGFTDNLPAGLLTNGAATTTCNGTVSNTASSVTLSAGALIPGSGSCFVFQPVISAVADNYLNSISSGALVTNFGSNTSTVQATLTVNSVAAGLTVAKAFSDPGIYVGESSSVVITINNNAALPATLVNLTETLPGGLVSLSNGSSTCGGILSGSPTQIILTGGSIGAGSSCTIVVPVFAQSPGYYINTVPEGAVSALVGTVPAVNADDATATLTVVPPEDRPFVTKEFIPDHVRCGYSELVLTLSNPTGLPISLIAPFVDRFPSDLVTLGGATTTCRDGDDFAIPFARRSAVGLPEGTVIPAFGFCQIRALVTSRCDGDFLNRIFPGDLQTNIGPNRNTATARINFCCEHLEKREQCLSINTVDEDTSYLEDLSFLEEVEG